MRTVDGDLVALALQGEFDVIVHGCNCFHTMGAGFAKAIASTFPEALEADRRTPYGEASKLGTISTARIERGGHGLAVVDAYTQFRWKDELGEFLVLRGSPLGQAAPTGRPTQGRRRADGPPDERQGAGHGRLRRRPGRAGWLALSFDHRGFGESEGGPRQFESPRRKAKDIQADVSFLTRHAGGRPVVAVRVCAGAGSMARAVAEDRRIAAFAGVAGYHAAAPQTEPMSDALGERLARAQAARVADEATGEAEFIPAVGPAGRGVAMSLDEAFDHHGTPRGAHPNDRNAFAVQPREETHLFDTQGAAPGIAAPTLIVHAARTLAPKR